MASEDKYTFSSEGQEVSSPLTSFRKYLGVLVKYKWYIIGFFLLTVAWGSLYTMRQPKVYLATATLLVEMREPSVLGYVQDVYKLGADWRTEEYLKTQALILKSRKIAERVVEKLGLDHDVNFLGLKDIDDPEILKQRMKKIDVVALLQSKLKVVLKKDSFIIYIMIQHNDPTLAALIANTYAETFIEQNLDRKLESTYNALQWLNKQAKELSTELEDAEQKLNEFKRDNDILATSMEKRISITSQHLMQLSRSLADARQRRFELESQWNQLKSIVPERDFTTISAPVLLKNQLLSSLLTDYFKLDAQIQELLEHYTEEHPKVAALRAKQEAVKKNIISEIKRVKTSVELAYKAALETEKKIADDMAAAKTKALNLHNQEVVYNMLVRKRDTINSLYQLVMRRLKEADMTRMFKSNNIYLVDSAVVPTRPILPKTKKNLLAAILLGLIGGIALAFILDFFDNTIKDGSELERLLKVPLLGFVPMVKQKEAAKDRHSVVFFPYHNPKSSIAESLRSLRINIHFLVPGKELRRILVTSAMPKEGKTTIAASLGITMAQSGLRTIVIDGDLRRPSIHRAYNLKKEPGVSEVVVGDMRLEDAIKHTEVENLDVLTSGSMSPMPAELVGSERFGEMIDKLDEMYDRIIIDSPPVSAVSDSLILSSLVDGVILVAKFGVTTKERLLQAKRSLEDVKANILGCVINELDLTNREYGYYYHYYYRRYGYSYSYGHYGEDVQESSSEPSKEDS